MIPQIKIEKALCTSILPCVVKNKTESNYIPESKYSDLAVNDRKWLTTLLEHQLVKLMHVTKDKILLRPENVNFKSMKSV